MSLAMTNFIQILCFLFNTSMLKPSSSKDRNSNKSLYLQIMVCILPTTKPVCQKTPIHLIFVNSKLLSLHPWILDNNKQYLIGLLAGEYIQINTHTLTLTLGLFIRRRERGTTLGSEIIVNMWTNLSLSYSCHLPTDLARWPTYF